jgi:hypothetical protein
MASKRATWGVLVCLCAGLLGGCGKSAKASDSGVSVPVRVSGPDLATGPSPVCKAWGKPLSTGAILGSELREASGIAASRRHPGILYLHDDGNENKGRIVAVDGTGKLRGWFKLKSVPDIDWEDIAVGACSREQVVAGASCLYLADTGDNNHDRTQVHILRTMEPEAMPAEIGDKPIKIKEKDVEVFAFTYPDGPQDVEALAVLPDSRVILMTKRDDGLAHVFRLTLAPGTGTVVEPMGTLDVREPPMVVGHPVRVTAADLTADGRQLLVRTYGRVLLFDVGLALQGPASADALRDARRTLLDGGDMKHCEAITWDPSGGFWQVAEGANPPLWHVGCGK